ncbi:MAG: histidine phosphatase family protein [Bacteroidetes bacterium]|nr:MAG: histidine phosphatase family protein [Bacteroidota bacterium]
MAIIKKKRLFVSEQPFLYFYTMKQLLIARHAKSSWNDFSMEDHERPILEKGRKKSEKVTAALKQKKILPDLIISSTAKRAKETAAILANGLGYPIDKIRYEKTIYHADTDDIFNELFALDDSIASVMVVGHNPTLTDLVNHFSKTMIDNLPTSAVAAVTFKADKWEKTGSSKFKLKFIMRPCEL